MSTERETDRADPGLAPVSAPPSRASSKSPVPQSNSGAPRRAAHRQQPWTPPMVIALVLVTGFGLLFAFGLVLIGVAVEVAIPSTLILVVGIMWRIVPGKPSDHGGDEKFILRLLHALQIFFGGGSMH